jgi:cytochrome b561
MIKNTKDSYGALSKALHWLLAFAIWTLMAVGMIMTDILEPPLKWEIYPLHKAFGVVVLFFVIIRIVWRFINVPVEIDITNKWQLLLARTTHYLMYIAMLMMPLTGIIMSLFSGKSIDMFGLFVIPAFEEKNIFLAKNAHSMHFIVAVIFIITIILHIIGALYHHYFLKDNTLRKML